MSGNWIKRQVDNAVRAVDQWPDWKKHGSTASLPPDAKQDLFVEGEFTAHSGATLFEKIECDALTDKDWECLAHMIDRRLPQFGQAIGVPRGGLKLAEILNALNAIGTDSTKPVVVVDDVLTTGRSLLKVMVQHPGSIGFVVFDRSGGKNLPPNCRALFTLDAVVGSFPHSNGPPQSST